MALGGMVLGALTSMLASARADPLPPSAIEEHTPRMRCAVALVVVGVDGSKVARAVDAATGRGGWSHLFIDPCRADEQGRRLVVDYTARHGVHWSDASSYAHRRQLRIELDAVTGTELWGCVRARLGRPFKVHALALGLDTASSCVGLGLACLPAELRRDIARHQVGPCISPNTIAAWAYATGRASR